LQPETLSATRYVANPKSDSDSAVKHSARLVGRSKRVLEIGPATGILTRVLVEEQDCRVTAIEIDPDAAKLAAPFCEQIHVADLERTELETLLGEQRFDVITFGDVLEHLRSPATALRKVRPFLTQSGYIVASVPNIAHASVTYELAHGRFAYRATGLLDATHIRFFTKENLLSLLEDAGFDLSELCRFALEPSKTEFHTIPRTKGQRALLDYLLDANPESRTYQFIVKAKQKPTPLQRPESTATLHPSDTTPEHESKAAQNVTLLMNSETAIAWSISDLAGSSLRRLKFGIRDIRLARGQ
jgi:2-polyprenyl-3-methyl-5-hydroxy-6-metoxy-1,4-benzoquinol methylase